VRYHHVVWRAVFQGADQVTTVARQMPDPSRSYRQNIDDVITALVACTD
jgi:hypothetical protein